MCIEQIPNLNDYRSFPEVIENTFVRMTEERSRRSPFCSVLSNMTFFKNLIYRKGINDINMAILVISFIYKLLV